MKSDVPWKAAFVSIFQGFSCLLRIAVCTSEHHFFRNPRGTGILGFFESPILTGLLL